MRLANILRWKLLNEAAINQTSAMLQDDRTPFRIPLEIHSQLEIRWNRGNLLLRAASCPINVKQIANLTFYIIINMYYKFCTIIYTIIYIINTQLNMTKYNVNKCVIVNFLNL